MASSVENLKEVNSPLGLFSLFSRHSDDILQEFRVLFYLYYCLISLTFVVRLPQLITIYLLLALQNFTLDF